MSLAKAERSQQAAQSASLRTGRSIAGARVPGAGSAWPGWSAGDRPSGGPSSAPRSAAYLFVGCLAMAAGALLYVIGEILPIGRRLS